MSAGTLIRACPPSRLGELIHLCESNESHGVSRTARRHYMAQIQGKAFRPWIVEDRDELVGTFGLHLETPITAILCYVMVKPPHQRKGIDTTILFSAVTMLPPRRNMVLWVSALPTALGFYARFGFERAPARDSNVLCRSVTEEWRSRAGAWLKDAGARTCL